MDLQKNVQESGDIFRNYPAQQPAAINAETSDLRIPMRRSETNEAAALLWFFAAAITLLISVTLTRLMF